MTITIHRDTSDPIGGGTAWGAAARNAHGGDYPPQHPYGGFDHISACGPEEPPTPCSSWCNSEECGRIEHWGHDIEVPGLEEPLLVRVGRYDSADDLRFDGTVGEPFVQIRTDSDALFSTEQGIQLQGLGLGLVAMETGTWEVPALCAALIRAAADAEGMTYAELLRQVADLLAGVDDRGSEAADTENDTIPGEVAIPGGTYVPGRTVRD